MTVDAVPVRTIKALFSALNEETGNEEQIEINKELPHLTVSVDILQRATPDVNVAKIQVLNLAPRTRGWLQRTIKNSIDEPNSTIKPNGSTPNPKRITGPSVAELEAKARNDVYAQIEMGYGERTGIFFEGSCQKVRNMKTRTDWVTELTLADAGATVFGAAVSREFAKKTRMLEVVRHLVRLMGLDDKFLTQASLNAAMGTNAQTFPAGLSAFGPAKWYLDTILGHLKADWFVDFGVFYIVPQGQPLDEPEVLINPDRGLLGRPQVMEDNGVIIRAILRNDIRICRQLRLESSDVNGVYRVEAVKHRGNNMRANFASDIQLATIEPVGAA